MLGFTSYVCSSLRNRQSRKKKPDARFAFLEDILAEFQEELKREFGSGSVDYRSRVPSANAVLRGAAGGGALHFFHISDEFYILGGVEYACQLRIVQSIIASSLGTFRISICSLAISSLCVKLRLSRSLGSS